MDNIHKTTDSASTHHYTMKEAFIFSQRMAQLSKALWKAVEKDWQRWIKPYDLNINEHHILWIAHHLKGASISDVANFGVMHVSTAFNFSKKLEERGLLTFSKKEDDKRNTYIEITPAGEQLIFNLMEHYEPESNLVFSGTAPLRELFGKFPDMVELMAIIRNIYGDDFMNIFETSIHNIERDFDEENGELKRAERSQASE
ncbi:HTH-type transcriptional regulator Hpr [Domibacillus robiginosus]|uniref:HTH-type transcriptional regulator Hpr n=1 Tax=Domibacillus robiginosus TaxID=1071054 RepID=UPI000AD74E8E|nr:HTH-type transcriptional regulator Hpr [Domibacillus robiginosus]